MPCACSNDMDFYNYFNIIEDTHSKKQIYSCNQNYSTPIANQVYWHNLQNFSCLQGTNKTKSN